MHDLILILITTVALATILNVLLKRFNIPTVIGYIFTGAIIGPLFGIHVHNNEQLEHIAEFGIVFLMFTIGLEFSVAHLKSMKKEVFLYGVLQVFLTATIIAFIANLFFNIEVKSGIVIGSALALSSTAIVLKILNESGKIKTEFGRNSLGILIFQDIAVIPILLMITIFTNQDQSISELLLATAINAVFALGILIILGKYVLGYFFKMVANANSKEIYMGSILFVVIGASYIAHHFGFSYSLGGFIAGMMIAETIYKYQVEADLIPFRDLLLGVFFISVGLQIDINVVIGNLLTVIMLMVTIMVIKSTTIFGTLMFFGPKKVALKTAITLAQIGEFSLVVFSLILSNHMLDPVFVQIFMVTIVLSMISTPFLISNLDKLVNLFIKMANINESIEESEIMGDHTILCGYGVFGKNVSSKLEEAKINHIIITSNTDDYVKAKEANKIAIFGDPSDRVLLDRLNIRKAMSTIIADASLDKIKEISASVLLIDPKLKVIAKVSNDEEKEELAEFHHELVLDGNNQIASVLVEQISKSRILAKETSKLQYLNSYSIENPTKAIELVILEQARLLDIMSKSFDGLRNGKDIMYIKAFHVSFSVLCEIIGNTINEITSKVSLSPKEYERINTILDNQRLMTVMNESLEQLGKLLKVIENNDKTKSLSQIAVEGLDTVLLSLKDIACEYNEEDMLILQKMTSSEVGLSKMREKYLAVEQEFDSETKTLLLSVTNSLAHLKRLFGSLGQNYQKLYQTL